MTKIFHLIGKNTLIPYVRKHVANLVAHVLTISFFFVYVLIIDKWLNTTKHVSISKVSISKDASKEKDFLRAKNGPRLSYAWRSIQFGKELLSQRLRKHVGNSRTVSVWIDRWIKGDVRRTPLMKIIFVDLELKVCCTTDMAAILLVRREEIREAEARPSLNELKVEVWKIPTAPKIKTFIWRAVSNAIPVGELLVKRGIKMDPVACGFQGESTTISYFNALLQDKYGRWTMYRIQKMKNGNIPEKVRNVIPWIVWYLWKFRNGVIFEARSKTTLEVVVKAMDEAEFWLMAQKNDEMKEKEKHEAVVVVKKSWSGPPRGWMKRNIGVDWNKAQAKNGAAWVVRDERGKVRFHSRRAFFNTRSLEEAKFQALIWSLESFHFHHLNRIIIAIDDLTLSNVVLRPRAWPNFKYQHAEIMKRLEKIEWWRILREDRSTNRGSFIIAQSVLKGGYKQSYVAMGAPFWLRELFENEEKLSSVGVET
ncbi:BnaC07g03300D [Brassica napus]|uniref:BnaC07g03300D protein n=1 Tax=Brassica napus TaxID=3708 RepID=A0A078FIQ2_BRANA|nr:BnaC07g03300D [Brassica napus]